jgi:hypothetical protein
VADLKTPVDWASGPACHYVSVKEQRRLPFSILRLLPFRAYTRKNLGYLYAISLGAQVIFDTDDDNLPTEGIKMRGVDDIESALIAYQVSHTSLHHPCRGFVSKVVRSGRPRVKPSFEPLRSLRSPRYLAAGLSAPLV